jgi:hypothetical protein
MLQLLAQLATLPPDQRAVIAALLTPAAVRVPAPPIPPAGTQSHDGEGAERLHGGHEGGKTSPPIP